MFFSLISSRSCGVLWIVGSGSTSRKCFSWKSGFLALQNPIFLIYFEFLEDCLS